MCLLVFSYKQHPNYELIFATNRDEFYGRPTRPAQFWDDYPSVLAGKDLKAGGTWLGITKGGRFSALTNYRDPSIQKENPPSRGHLVLDYLKGDKKTNQYLQEVDKKANKYNGFNLLAGNLSKNRMTYYSNRQQEFKILEAGLYGLSNKLLDTPWPKVQRAKRKLAEIIDSSDIPEEDLFDLLKDYEKAPEDELPDTGIPKELERAVSPIFIKTENYGTRNSTVILVDKNGKVTFEERRFNSGTQVVEESNRYEFLME
ncbi:MAG: NRDE family protein [Candidatus Halalkalibacterium sp. M3_1C_030]